MSAPLWVIPCPRCVQHNGKFQTCCFCGNTGEYAIGSRVLPVWAKDGCACFTCQAIRKEFPQRELRGVA